MAYKSVLKLITVSLICIILAVFVSAGVKKLASNESKKILQASAEYSYVADGYTSSNINGKSYKIKIRVYNKKPDKHRINYLSSPMKGATLCYTNNFMWSANCGNQPMHAKRYAYADSENKAKLFLSNHNIYKIADTVMAKRPAYIAEVKNAAGIPIKRLWIDKSTGISLRTDTLDRSGKAISSTELTNINFNKEISDSLFKKPDCESKEECKMSFRQVSDLSALSENVGFKVMVPKYIPKGYHIDSYNVYECSRKGDKKMAYIRYSNGASGLSIFQGKCVCPSDGSCMTNKSNDDNSVAIDKNGIRINVIAGFDITELKRVLNSIK